MRGKGRGDIFRRMLREIDAYGVVRDQRERAQHYKARPSVRTLAKELGVCPRTIRRDLAIIEEHIPSLRSVEDEDEEE